ncbi:MAG: PhzF family phenazine biosynthesis protein [Candidatus Aminicenantes bacterium]
MKTFYIVDVFAERKYAGNQLAVFRDGGQYSSEKMQILAREMNFSETTFIITDKKKAGGFDVRIFTPAREVPFAGHPTLGTAFIIQRHLIQKPVDKVILNLEAGQIPVTFTYAGDEAEWLWMRQKTPRFGDSLDLGLVAESLHLNRSDLDGRFPAEEVSTGIPFLIVPVKTLAAMKRARVNQDLFMALVKDKKAKAPLLFCPETYSEKHDLNVRVFADYYQVPEDAATGSANGCLAGYLVKNRFFQSGSIDIHVEQGCEIGRPSLLCLKAEEKEKEIVVHVGGRVFSVAQGELE